MPVRPIAAGLAVIAAAVLVVVLASGRGGEVGAALDLTPDPAFRASVSGALYDARTIGGRDGTSDVAYLTRDGTLRVAIAASDVARIAEAVITVDGRVSLRRAASCPRGRCPRTLRFAAVPSVISAGAGTHRVEVVVRPVGGRPATTVSRFDVRVGDPRSTPGDIEPQVASPGPIALDRPARGVDRVLRGAARRSPLLGVLGRSRLRLRERGTGSGAVTVLADVVPPRRNVGATLPQRDDDGPARMHANVLSDLVLDVDVPSGRVIGVQPGPTSVVDRWSTGTAAHATEDEVPSPNFTAAAPPRLHRLSDHGPSFLVEDGAPDLRPAGRDWPVSVVFAGHATVASVKAGLRRLGLVRRGGSRSLGYREPGTGLLRFDADRGLKTRCDAAGTDLHVRVYAPTTADRFVDPELGSVVLATVHLDHVDGCGAGPTYFGFSERAESRLADLVRRGLRWHVRRDALAIGDPEPLRRDRADPGHLWLADGAATVIDVP